MTSEKKYWKEKQELLKKIEELQIEQDKYKKRVEEAIRKLTKLFIKDLTIDTNEKQDLYEKFMESIEGLKKEMGL